ncbi:hypothetical protein ACTQ49_02150 [Luteococcus sp. Sow4_B9]|uniref:hypothetical protein n=1 Tax=Luteococcus sp. Sow4_B9 TaxID=3438792 RepID=UPI003F9A6E0E
MSHTIRIPAVAPFELLSTAPSSTVWGRLEEATDFAAVSTVWGAASRQGDQVTLWLSDPPEAARRAAVGDPEPPRRGLGRFFGAQVVVTRRDLKDSDVVLAVLLALHPRGRGWPQSALPPSVQSVAVQTVVGRRRADGTPWHITRQCDEDAVAELLCEMAGSFQHDSGEENEARLVELARNMPATADEARRVMDELL